MCVLCYYVIRLLEYLFLNAEMPVGKPRNCIAFETLDICEKAITAPVD